MIERVSFRYDVERYGEALERRLVAVGPPRDLVQVVPEAGDLARPLALNLTSSLALDVVRCRGPGAGVHHGLAQQGRRRDAGRGRLRAPRRKVLGRDSRLHQRPRRGFPFTGNGR